MNIRELSARYAVRRLTQADIDAVLELMRGNPLFYAHCSPKPSRESIAADMRALPPRTEPKDKYYLGFFDGGTLIAVLDLILGYPNAETAFVGFFMVAAQRQGCGLGTLLVSEITACLRAWGFRRTRLGYVKGNAQSRAFWRKNGFAETGLQTNTESYTIVVMQREN